MAEESASCKPSGPVNAGTRPVEYGSSRTVYILPTTGGQIELQVPPDSSVTTLRRVVATKLRVPRDRIVLLYKTRQLTEGTLEENHITDGARLTLLPSVETGLLAQRPEQSVLQALESLSDTQVDNFLTGRAPLNLTMRLGDHMMFIQLQLSTVTPSTSTCKPCSTSHSPNTQSLPTPPTTPTTPTPKSPLPFPLPSSVPPSPPPSPKNLTPPSLATPGASSTTEEIRTALNTRALAEASRNLTQTLRQLSSAALGKKMSCEAQCCKSHRQGGAVIESMYHHGRGIYSGTFSGTLSPALQDHDGRPRRDISTIIHILNDLLGASSQCRPSSHCHHTGQHSEIASHSTHDGQLGKEGDPERQNENKALRGKVEQLQSMLEERRQKRRARREVRMSPYSTINRSYHSQETSSHVIHERMDCEAGSSSMQGSSLGGSTVSSDSSEKMTDFSSEAAVA